MIRERRTWDSLLAPVYVQLLDGLRRITEGQRGAAFCKECGNPFLVLDAGRGPRSGAGGRPDSRVPDLTPSQGDGAADPLAPWKTRCR